MNYPLQERLLSLLLNIVTLGFAGCVERGTHKEMTTDFTETFVYASYSDFKKSFDGATWSPSKGFPESLFDYDSDSEFHAAIIKINGIGYLLSTYGLMKAQRMVKRYRLNAKMIKAQPSH